MRRSFLSGGGTGDTVTGTIGFSYAADALVSLVNGAIQWVRPGSAATTVAAVAFTGPGIVVTVDGRLSRMTARHVGSINPGPSVVAYALFVNGVIVPGSTITLPANGAAFTGNAIFTAVNVAAGDVVQVLATPAGGVAITPSDIMATVA